VRAEVNPLSPTEGMPRSMGSGTSGTLSAEMLAVQLADMKEAVAALPSLMREVIAELQGLSGKYDTMLERMTSLVEAAGTTAQAIEDVRDDVDHVAQEVAIRNADYIRERREREQE
jgi:hypothetical protein